MQTELFTTAYLGTYAGLVAVTYLLVQFFKEPLKNKFSDWSVRMLAVFIALGIQLFVLFVNGQFVVEPIGLAVLNSFLIAITAAGMHNLGTSSTVTTTDNTTAALATDTITQAQIIDVNPVTTTNTAAEKISTTESSEETTNIQAL